jgi:hypothetical protein
MAEGYPFFYQRITFPFKDGKMMYAYICINPLYCSSPKAKPTEEYIQHILKGCIENKLVKTVKLIENMYVKKRV